MKLVRADETSYPKLHHYLKNDIPKLIRHKKISDALLTYGQINRLSLPLVLNYGTGPVVKITPLVRACGQFTPNASSNELRLHKSLVDQFESSAGDKILLQTVGATILHELVHWGDDQDGVDYPGEEGVLFEKHVYNLAQHHCSQFYPHLVRKGVIF